MQKDESVLRRSVRQCKLTGPIKVATELKMPAEPSNNNPDRDFSELDLIEVPTLPELKILNKQTEKEKMGTVLSVLAQVCDKLSEVNTTIHDDVSGITTRLGTCQTQADNTLDLRNVKEDKASVANATKTADDLATLQRENHILKGLVQ